MNEGVFAASIRTKVLRFNGNLFAEAKALPLGREEIGELAEAANKDWHEVEPAIFGTLLEQALDPAERKRLGAHYTPRAYVERLGGRHHHRAAARRLAQCAGGSRNQTRRAAT